MKKLFWERSFDSIATNLVSIFIPVYLLRLHYSLQHIFIFYALTGLFMVLIYPLGFLSIVRIGANRTIVLGNIANAVFFVFLLRLTHATEPLWLLAIFRAGYSAFYFPAFTVNFVAARAHRRTGLQVGRMNAVALLLGGLAPAIGGFFASRFGIDWAYGVAVGTIGFANIPLLLGRENLKHAKFQFSHVPWRASKDFIANGLYNIPGFVETVIWPLAISLLLASYSGIGLLTSVMVLTTVFISLYVGMHEDRVGEKPYINEGVATGALGNIGKLFASAPLGIMGVNFISGISDALLANSFISRYYKNADSEHMLEYTFGMEVTHAIVWTLYFGILAIVATWFSLKVMLFFGIILAIPSIFGVRMIRTSNGKAD